MHESLLPNLKVTTSFNYISMNLRFWDNYVFRWKASSEEDEVSCLSQPEGIETFDKFLYYVRMRVSVWEGRRDIVTERVYAFPTP